MRNQTKNKRREEENETLCLWLEEGWLERRAEADTLRLVHHAVAGSISHTREGTNVTRRVILKCREAV